MYKDKPTETKYSVNELAGVSYKVTSLVVAMVIFNIGRVIIAASGDGT